MISNIGWLMDGVYKRTSGPRSKGILLCYCGVRENLESGENGEDTIGLGYDVFSMDVLGIWKSGIYIYIYIYMAYVWRMR